MKKYIVIIVALVITGLNINAYGKLDDKKLEEAKEMALTNNKISLDNETHCFFGLSLFKLIHVAEILLIADIARRNYLNQF